MFLGIPLFADIQTQIEARWPKDARIFERHPAWPPPTFLGIKVLTTKRLKPLIG